MNAIFVLTAFAILNLFIGLTRRKGWLTVSSCVGVFIAMVLVLGEWVATNDITHASALSELFARLHIANPNGPVITQYMQGMMHFDNFAIAFSVVILLSAFFLFLFVNNYFSENIKNLGDIHALILFVIIGAMMMVAYSNMAILFIGIETLSITLYILAGSRKLDFNSNEAALKYFIMGAFSTGFLLLGMALMYGPSGQLENAALAGYVRQVTDAGLNLPIIFQSGALLLLVGLLFKVSAAPFHFWAPDVYQGSPTIVTGVMATIAKTAAFGALLRILFMMLDGFPQIFEILMIVTVMTLVIGNFSAIYQTSVKRMLAFSSVSNAGYMLICVMATLALRSEGNHAPLLLYALSYSLATVLAMSVLTFVAKGRGGDTYEHIKGLAHTNPVLAGTLTVAMLSLAGIPPLAGFMAKFYMFKTSFHAVNMGIEGGMTNWLLFVALGMSLVGVFYYLKVIIAIFTPDPKATQIQFGSGFKVALLSLSVVILAIGLFPNLFINPFSDKDLIRASTDTAEKSTSDIVPSIAPRGGMAPGKLVAPAPSK